MELAWENIKAGDELPELRKTPDLTQLVKYAAGSGDFNPLHYDPDSAPAKKIGRIIVHGRFKYASMGQLVAQWLGHRGRIKKLSCQYRGMDFPGEEMVCRGVVASTRQEDNQKLVEIDLWVQNSHGQKTSVGKALVSVA
ncbi:MAG: MaoC/PaaZ C-terminal domain-containing protein [Thermodesulfobacteriota bacterium]